MRSFRSSNPVLRRTREYDVVSDTPITYSNVAIKTVFLLTVAVVSAIITMQSGVFNLGILFGGMIIGFIAVIVGTRSIRLAPFAGVVYALAEGTVLGFVSALYEGFYDNIVITAVTTTALVFVIMLLLFSTKIIKVNQKFASFMVVALMAVIVMSLFAIILPSVFGGEMFMIVVILSSVLSAFFLLLDFQSIQNSVESGMDQKVGWMLAIGLMVTIVWIYFEMLRLLAVFSRNN